MRSPLSGRSFAKRARIARTTGMCRSAHSMRCLPSRASFMSLTWPATAAPLVAAPLLRREVLRAIERSSREGELSSGESDCGANARRDCAAARAAPQLEKCTGRGPGVEHMLSHMKRTTLILDAGIYADLKRRAAAQGRTFTEVVEHALRLGIQAQASGRRGRVRLPSYDLGPFLVDPSDRVALATLSVPEPESR